MSPIDVVIPTWNGRHLLEECLRALESQTRACRAIVVDNGSTDGTREWLQAAWPSAMVVTEPVNRGFAGAAQVGIEAAESELVAVLNNDARPKPMWLEACAGVFADPSVAACASVILTPAGRVESAGLRFTVWGVGRRNMEGCGLDELPPLPVRVFGASGGAAVFRKEAVHDVGGLDEAFFAQDEDIDLALRLCLAGYHAVLHPGALVSHLGGTTLRREPAKALWLAQRNLEWAFWANLPVWSWLLLGPPHVTYQGASLLRHLSRGTGRTVAAAKWAALRGLASRVRARRGTRRSLGTLLPWLFCATRPWVNPQGGEGG